MWPQKYLFDHFNQSMRPGPNWKLNISKLFRKSISTLTGLIVSPLVRKCVFYRPELTGKLGPHGTGIKFLKFKSEMCQQIELKEYMRKMRSFVQLCLLPELWSLKCQEWLDTFCWIQQKISSSLGKIFKCNCKALFGPFRKYYGLCTSGQPLGNFQRLKLEDFGIPLLT